MQFPNEESSSSKNSDEKVIRLESHFNREKSVTFINNVFALVGQSPIRDLRRTNYIREKSNHVVRLIR